MDFLFLFFLFLLILGNGMRICWDLEMVHADLACLAIRGGG
jgi:hypothetical protein